MSYELKTVLQVSLYLLIFGVLAGFTLNFYLSQDYLFSLISLFSLTSAGYIAIKTLVEFQRWSNKKLGD
jgi:hypothetical protein